MSKVTLTFDNGPEPVITPRVLDILARRGLKTTFFVVGQKLLDPERMELAIRAREEGHRIGNHTFTHSTPLGQMEDPDAAVEELEQTDSLIASTGETAKLFRPFGGGGKLGPHLLNVQAVEFLRARAYSCVLWNAVPGDWADPDGWVDRALGQISSLEHTLMVLHDLPTGAMQHLETFLDRAAASGAEFDTEFPDECVPMNGGRDMMPLTPYVAAG